MLMANQAKKEINDVSMWLANEEKMIMANQ
jgi:hypothetical protein